MTKRFDLAEDLWAGMTVAILASGPSMSAEVVAALTEQADRVIAINSTSRIAPHADVLFALDTWPEEWRSFAGMRVTGIEDDTLDAYYIGHVFDRVTHPTRGNIEIRNSTLSAIRFAKRLGAAYIIVAGFEPEKAGYFFDPASDTSEKFVGVREGFDTIVAEFALDGIPVELYSPRRSVDV